MSKDAENGCLLRRFDGGVTEGREHGLVDHKDAIALHCGKNYAEPISSELPDFLIDRQTRARWCCIASPWTRRRDAKSRSVPSQSELVDAILSNAATQNNHHSNDSSPGRIARSLNVIRDAIHDLHCDQYVSTDQARLRMSSDTTKQGRSRLGSKQVRVRLAFCPDDDDRRLSTRPDQTSNI